MSKITVFVLAFGVAVLLRTAAAAEEGCPPGKFPDGIDRKKCTAVYRGSVLPLSDDKPMRFEAVQMSLVITWIQATGTITEDTPSAGEP